MATDSPNTTHSRVPVEDIEGLPVGRPGPDGYVTCDGCNATLTDGNALFVHEAADDVGGDRHIVTLRCRACGPVWFVAARGRRVSAAVLRYDADARQHRLADACLAAAVTHTGRPTP
jgi:hypothetical protein